MVSLGALSFAGALGACRVDRAAGDMVATASDATDSEKNHVPADTFVVRDRDGSRDIGPNPLVAFGLKVGSREFDNFCCGATAVECGACR